MKNALLMLLAGSVLAGCGSIWKGPEAAPVRKPDNASVTAQELKTWGPVNLLQGLKSHCCNGVMIEKTVVTFWGEAEIAELQKYVDDTAPSAPVYRPSSAVMCHGPKYVSSVGREARHLIEGIKKGTYPVSQCSTYDLQFSE
ncbi:hypothetical protein ACES2I_07310 [Bdellovibrio bacteriovorus]|uniref:hypothetical protein n=1 Tax=Bdellovibrio bacteriovorus TaxID=959 RepID=UPI0035A69E3B